MATHWNMLDWRTRMGREAGAGDWRATVHQLTKSWTQLNG